MKKTFTILFVFILVFVNIVKAQFLSDKLKGPVPVTVCYASGKTEKISIPPPEWLLLKSEDTKLSTKR